MHAKVVFAVLPVLVTMSVSCDCLKDRCTHIDEDLSKINCL